MSCQLRAALDRPKGGHDALHVGVDRPLHVDRRPHRRRRHPCSAPCRRPSSRRPSSRCRSGRASRSPSCRADSTSSRSQVAACRRSPERGRRARPLRASRVPGRSSRALPFPSLLPPWVPRRAMWLSAPSMPSKDPRSRTVSTLVSKASAARGSASTGHASKRVVRWQAGHPRRVARMATFDAVLVGSGINTITAAALLAREGWGVCVLERSERLGGAIRTEADYTLPGFTHEVMSSWHPLFTGSAAYAELGDELHRRRPRVRQHGPARPRPRSPTGARCSSRRRWRPTSRSSTGSRAGDGTAWQRQFEQFMANADLSFGVLGTELWSPGGARARTEDSAALRPPRAAPVRRPRPLDVPRLDDGDVQRAAEAHGLLAPWVLHTGLGPENAVSGFMTQVIACAVQLGGNARSRRRRSAARRRARGHRA